MEDEEEDIYDAVARFRENHPELMKKDITAFDLLTKAKKVIQSMKVSMLVHPDFSSDSEFDDLTTLAQELEDEIESFLKDK